MLKHRRILVIADSPVLRARFDELVEERELKRRVDRIEVRSSDGRDVPRIDVASAAADIAREFDLLLSLHCRQIIPLSLTDAMTCINLHPGYNPHNRGWFPHVFGLIRGLPIGATLHQMTSRIDDGPIIARRVVQTHAWDDSSTIYERVQAAELDLLEAHLESLLAGDFQTIREAATEPPNSQRDFSQLCELDLEAAGTVGSTLTTLRALSHPPFWNAFFTAPDGTRVFVRLTLRRESDLE